MRVASCESTACVEFEDGIHVAVSWGGDQWKVIDQPSATKGTLEWCSTLITHPPEIVLTWRFTAKNFRTNQVFIFNFERDESGWGLLNVWD